MYRVNVVDTRTGRVTHTQATGSLKSLKHTLQDCCVSTKGICKTDQNLVTYIFDEEWTEQQLTDICSSARKHEAASDVREFGLEFYIFHDMYMSDYERTQLYHSDEKSNFTNEDKLQSRLTQEDKRLSKVFEAIRQGKSFYVNPDGAATTGRGTPDRITKVASGANVTFGALSFEFGSPKYHRIHKEAI